MIWSLGRRWRGDLESGTVAVVAVGIGGRRRDEDSFVECGGGQICSRRHQRGRGSSVEDVSEVRICTRRHSRGRRGSGMVSTMPKEGGGDVSEAVRLQRGHQPTTSSLSAAEGGSAAEGIGEGVLQLRTLVRSESALEGIVEGVRDLGWRRRCPRKEVVVFQRR